MRRDGFGRTAFAMALALSAAGTARAAVETAGKIDAVTVYRGQALVTRVVDVPGQGLTEVVVTNLPEQIVEGSLFAEAEAGVEVRSTRFRTRPVSTDVRQDVRKKDEQIRSLQDGLAAAQREAQLLTEQTAYLDALQKFTAATAGAELTRGVLNADTLKTLTGYEFDQRRQIADAEIKLSLSSRDKTEQLALAERERAELTAGSGRTVREAVVFANFPKANGRLRVKYLVGASTWSPSYVARATGAVPNAKRTVALQYNAAVQQMSGEDWSDVAMTLSTATPSMVATAPPLDALRVTLVAKRPEEDAGSYATRKAALSQQRFQLENDRNSNAAPVPQGGQQAAGGGFGTAGPGFAGAEQDAGLNDLAGKMQLLELASKATGGREARARNDEVISVTYQLPTRTSLPSRADQQLIQIASADLAGDFYKLAMPVLTSYVYDQATVTNAGKTVLLAGPVQSYLNDQYVGLGTLPTVAAGEAFTVGFGIDSSLRAARELVDKTEAVQGGNRVLTFAYRLTVENFGTAPATVRLMDRLPTGKEPEVRVAITSATGKPTTQPTTPPPAGTAARRAGILTWTTDVPAAAMGDKAAAVEYGFRLEFDRQMSIAEAPAK